MKNAIESISNRTDQTEERISDLENKNIKIIQLKERELRSKKSKKKKKKTLWELLISIWKARLTGVPERGEREKTLFKEKVRTSQNLDKHTTKLIEQPITSMQKDLLQHTLHWNLKINYKES